MNTAIKANDWLVAAEIIYDPGERVAAAVSEVVQAYVKLVDCIAAFGDQCAAHGKEMDGKFGSTRKIALSVTSEAR
jgi:hypothetical protein